MERRQKGIRTFIILSAMIITALFLWRSYSVRPLILYTVEMTASAAERKVQTQSAIPVTSQSGEKPVLIEERGNKEQEIIMAKSVNINTAEAEELEKLPGIGPALADRIIRYREENNGFYDIEELMEVNGIGEKTFQKLQEFIVAE